MSTSIHNGVAMLSPPRHAEPTTPTTPRQQGPWTSSSSSSSTRPRTDDASTPTRSGFVPHIHPAEDSVRPGSSISTTSRLTEVVDMERSDGETGDGDEPMGGSDVESGDGADGDATQPSKKKKTQRFYCTDYPPCNLSFTRSEHLARHIRKHTGERPFQCHCSRRFSRLDNLRQHAQTVHVNEDIPGDSLAATGTRFQRQIRTERIRPVNNRARLSTGSNGPPPMRGHQRNALSTSSVGSVGSSYSALGGSASSYNPSADRRRPAPLMMAADPRSRYGGDMYPPESPTSQYPPVRPPSPGLVGTPTSATFAHAHPRFSQASPSMHARGPSQGSIGGGPTSARRLSVPSAQNPFQIHPPAIHPMATMTATSPASSGLASPTTSTASSMWSRRDSVADDGADWRRRTWHPDSGGFSGRPAQGNFVQNYYANGQPPPPTSIVPSHAAAMRLPGIESFDPLRRPVTPPRRGPSPMMIDTPGRASFNDSRPTSSWESGIRGMHMLEITQGTPPSDVAGSWASDTTRAISQAEAVAMTPPSVRFEAFQGRPMGMPNRPFHQHTNSAPIIHMSGTNGNNKRGSWHLGPGPVVESSSKVLRTSPDSNSSEGGVPGTPGTGSYGDPNPAILHANGYIESRPPIDPRILASNTPNPFLGKVAAVNFSQPRPSPRRTTTRQMRGQLGAAAGVEDGVEVDGEGGGGGGGHVSRAGGGDGDASKEPMSKLDALVAAATRDEAAGASAATF